jgi:hypothetical protein
MTTMTIRLGLHLYDASHRMFAEEMFAKEEMFAQEMTNVA